MIITATVVDPFDINKVKYRRISFSDVPIDGNLISIENEMYRIYRTLFKQKDTSFGYDFEQLIKKELDITERIPKEYYLILGQVSFDLNDEVNSFLKKLKSPN